MSWLGKVLSGGRPGKGGRPVGILGCLALAFLIDAGLGLTAQAQRRDPIEPSMAPSEVITSGMRSSTPPRPLAHRGTADTRPRDEVMANGQRRRLVVRQGGQVGLQFPRPDQVNTARVKSRQGDLLLETKSLEKDIVLDMSHLAPGAYELELESGGQTQAAELIVQ